MKGKKQKNITIEIEDIIFSNNETSNNGETVKEKDTKTLAEKEALRNRKRLYEAKNFINQAFSSNYKLERIKLANAAIEASEDCAEAYILLAEELEENLHTKKELYEKALEAGKRLIGEDNFKEYEGRFWSFTETRPFMNAKFKLAEVLWEIGDRKEAIDHLKEMLKLNPNDNQGVRYTLIKWLIEENEDRYIEKLFKEFEEETSAAFSYGMALYYFKNSKDIRADQYLKISIDNNPYVPLYLLGYKQITDRLSPFMGLGDEMEAQHYAFEYGELWEDTEGALEWMRESIPAKNLKKLNSLDSRNKKRWMKNSEI